MEYSQETMTCYYLKFKIKKKKDRMNSQSNQVEISGDQYITISLAHDSLTDTDTQTLKTVFVPKATTDSEANEYVTFDLVIPPNDSYDEIRLVLKREASFDDREITLDVDVYALIKNIISSLGGPSKTRLKQIGVQGKTGLQMCINGESIEIGRTRIYEINHGYEILFLGFIYYKEDPDDPNETLEPFILDYQY